MKFYSLTTILIALCTILPGCGTHPDGLDASSQVHAEVASGQESKLSKQDRSIGIVFEGDGRSWFVKSVLAGSSAEAAGIMANDRVLAIEDLSMDTVTSDTRDELRSRLNRAEITVVLEREGVVYEASLPTTPASDVYPDLFGETEQILCPCYWNCFPSCFNQDWIGNTCGTCFACFCG